MKRTAYKLPKSGVHDDNGYLFYHSAPRRLDEAGKRLLSENGIELSTKQFNAAEDKILTENWAAFSDKYNLKLDEASWLAGLNVRPQGGLTERQIFIHRTFFYQKMCEGLPNRTCENVMLRMRDLFDPAKLAGIVARSSFSKEEDNQLVQFYQEGRSYNDISMLMKRSLARIKSRVKFFRKHGVKRDRVQPFFNSEISQEHAWHVSYSKTLCFSACDVPESGILDENGELFYHMWPQKFSASQTQLLLDHGVILSAARCNTAELEQIKSNWQAYAEEFNVPDCLAPWLAGYRHLEAILKLVEFSHYDLKLLGMQQQERLLFLRRSKFWPRICSGLVTRSAWSLKFPILQLFDPFTLIGMGTEKWTDDDDKRCDWLYRRCGSRVKVSVAMRRPAAIVINRMASYKMRSMPINMCERRKIWILIEKLFDVNPVEAVKSAIQSGCLKNPKIRFKKLARTMSRTVEVVEACWTDIVHEFENLLQTSDWDSVFETVIPEAPRMTGEQFADFVELFHEEVPNVLLRHMRLDHSELVRMERLMIRMGLDGFYTARFSPLKYCLKRLNVIVRSICRKLSSVTDLSVFTITEVLSVIAQCSRTFPNSVKLVFKTTDFLETLFAHKRRVEPEYEPPKKLLRWIKKQGKRKGRKRRISETGNEINEPTTDGPEVEEMEVQKQKASVLVSTKLG